MARTRAVVLAIATVLAATTVGATSVPATGVTSAGETAAHTSTVEATTGTRATPPIEWKRCKSRWLRRTRAQCGFVTVPLNYDNPSGRTIKIAVSRVRHTTRRFRGVMLINPGGPGAAGRELATYGRLMPGRSGASYDWIGFDPRGSGGSRPALSCEPYYFHADRPPYVPRKPGDVRVWLHRSKSYAEACAAKHGALLEHMKTIDHVRDMDRIRAALGVEQISFYGYSYGTYLGQVFATLFPNRLHRMVLDSNVDPVETFEESGRTQTLAFQRVFEMFFAWVARHRDTYRLGRTAAAVERLYLKQRRVLDRRPARGVLGPSEFDDAMVFAGYAEYVWPELAAALASWVRHRNPRPLIRWWRFSDTPGDDNLYAGFLATTCTDGPLPSLASELASARRLHRQAPSLTWNSTWFTGPCFFWPVQPGTPVAVDGRGVEVLLFGQTFDGATPFANSLAVRRIFPQSRLVAIRGGATHGSTPDLAGACARRHLAAYLKTGQLPPRRPGNRADVTCNAPPPPRPRAAP
jgi:pimeloyl-ACP methyl ester carboxylesterase